MAFASSAAKLTWQSFFGTQEGDFSLSIRSISAISKVPPPASTTSTTVAKDDRGLEEAIDGFETSDPYIHLNINLGFFKVSGYCVLRPAPTLC